MTKGREYLYKNLPSVDYKLLDLSRHTKEKLKQGLGEEVNLGLYTLGALAKKCNLDHISIMELEEKLQIKKN